MNKSFFATITLIFCFIFAQTHNCWTMKKHDGVKASDIMHDEDDDLIPVIDMKDEEPSYNKQKTNNVIEDEDADSEEINPVAIAFILGTFLSQHNKETLLFERLKNIPNETMKHVSSMLKKLPKEILVPLAKRLTELPLEGFVFLTNLLAKLPVKEFFRMTKMLISLPLDIFISVTKMLLKLQKAVLHAGKKGLKKLPFNLNLNLGFGTAMTLLLSLPLVGTFSDCDAHEYVSYCKRDPLGCDVDIKEFNRLTTVCTRLIKLGVKEGYDCFNMPMIRYCDILHDDDSFPNCEETVYSSFAQFGHDLPQRRSGNCKFDFILNLTKQATPFVQASYINWNLVSIILGISLLSVVVISGCVGIYCYRKQIQKIICTIVGWCKNNSNKHSFALVDFSQNLEEEDTSGSSSV